MAFIDIIPFPEIDADVRAMYERQQAHYGFVPDYAKVFCYRPHIMQLWAQLLAGIKRNMDKRRFELVTLVAATELRSTLCSLAHGRALTEFLAQEDVQTLAKGGRPESLSDADAAMVTFARKVARDASAITREDVQALKEHGFTDAEVFDIVATAAARAFFTKVVESLGVGSDAPLRALDPELRETLSVGRPPRFVEPETLAPAEPVS
ncbi:MAG TPA: hypothetical protein VF193_16675 [Steroidobacter sp.]